MQTMVRLVTGPCVKCLSVLGAGLLPLLLSLALGLATPVQAAGVVTDCSSSSDFIARLGGGGLVTFNCPFPGPTVITISYYNGIIPAPDTTVDGSNHGHPITLSGGHTNRVFHHIAGGNTLTLTHLTLRDGNAGNDFGGCIINEGDLVVLIDVTITHCIAGQFGGGYEGLSLQLVNSRVISNTAKGGGGLSAGRALTIVNSLISDNLATGTDLFDGGGGMYLNQSVLISRTQLVNNHAVFEGGGLYLQAGSAKLNEVTLSGNVADAAGGGITIDRHGLLTLTNSTLSNNIAALPYGIGGGIENYNFASLSSVTLNGNMAGSGGGFYNSVVTSVARLDDVRFSNNSSVFDGGGYFNDGGNLFSANGIFNGNTALRNGGALYNAGGASRLDYTLLAQNAAGQHGGGIYNDAYLSIIFAQFSGNTAGQNGGAIYNSSELNLFDATLDGNRAAQSGGGLYNDVGIASLLNTTVSGNRATNSGGGMEVHYGWADLRNVTVSANGAGSGGGVHVLGGSLLTLTNTIIANSPQGGNCTGGAVASAQYSLSSDVTCNLTGWPARPNPNGVNALLSALGNYGGLYPVHMPKIGSPTIDGVVGANAPPFDERGVARPQGGGFDIGAVERQASDRDLAPRLYLPLLRR